MWNSGEPRRCKILNDEERAPPSSRQRAHFGGFGVVGQHSTSTLRRFVDVGGRQRQPRPQVRLFLIARRSNAWRIARRRDEREPPIRAGDVERKRARREAAARRSAGRSTNW